MSENKPEETEEISMIVQFGDDAVSFSTSEGAQPAHLDEMAALDLTNKLVDWLDERAEKKMKAAMKKLEEADKKLAAQAGTTAPLPPHCDS